MVIYAEVSQFFNFGPNVKRWIRTSYKNISTFVSVDGHYTKLFGVCRGVRQGDPRSSYLYRICTEILSAMIGQNVNIKGIKLKDNKIF